MIPNVSFRDKLKQKPQVKDIESGPASGPVSGPASGPNAGVIVMLPTSDSDSDSNTLDAPTSQSQSNPLNHTLARTYLAAINHRQIEMALHRQIETNVDQDQDQEKPIVTKITKVGKMKALIEPPKASSVAEVNPVPLANYIRMGNEVMANRLPVPKETETFRLRTSDYYMNNREIFIQYMNQFLEPYKEVGENDERLVSCDALTTDEQGNDDIRLLAHQRLVRDYMNVYTPYRGLLLYHGLGSGKTCTSIAIAEGMKNSKRVIVMTPKSLRQNYLDQIKKCGDSMYRTNQYWEWISTEHQSQQRQVVHQLATVLGLSPDYITKQKGAWLVNATKPSNHESIQRDSAKKQSLDKQINEMIHRKYEFHNYNGMSLANYEALTDHWTRNIFDHAVVIVDEAHNLISRIVNQLNKWHRRSPASQAKAKASQTIPLALRLYEDLKRAIDCRIIFLTGTPVVNFPNEMAILFNILRGYMYTWTLTLKGSAGAALTKESLYRLLQQDQSVDYIHYVASSKQLTITRNPMGFSNVVDRPTGAYKGVTKEEDANVVAVPFVKAHQAMMTDDAFIIHVVDLLKAHRIQVQRQTMVANVALPDNLEVFNQTFFDDTRHLKEDQKDKLKRRIVGLTSYFRSAQNELMPTYDPIRDTHLVEIPMSDYQFNQYEQARSKERETDQKARQRNNKNNKRPTNATHALFQEDALPSYRLYSRLACNFALPNRPKPKSKRTSQATAVGGQHEGQQEVIVIDDDDDEVVDANANANANANVVDVVNVDEVVDVDEAVDVDVEEELEGDYGDHEDAKYQEELKQYLQTLKADPQKYLSPAGLATYSPKMLIILNHLNNEQYQGLHLLYSQFLTLEGIGLMAAVLDANGYTELKVKKGKESGEWELDIEEGKPMYGLYTGSSSKVDDEKKEIVRKIFNGEWTTLSNRLRGQLLAKSNTNKYGDIVKLLMITASGAEGINLRNTRYIHGMEMYWHYVRIEQVIGRARRMCSHTDFEDEAMRTVEVFLYVMVLTEAQQKSETAKELIVQDVSKASPHVVQTTDQYLYELSMIKAKVNAQLTTCIKESSIDCATHAKSNHKEGLKCLSIGNNPNPGAFLYAPNEQDDNKHQGTLVQTKTNTWTGQEIKIDNKTYIQKQDTDELYEPNSVQNGQPERVATLVQQEDGDYVVKRYP